MKDYVIYIDTDSLFVHIKQFLIDQGKWEAFEKLPDDQKVKFIRRMSAYIEKYVDSRSFEETQFVDYNSAVDTFKIVFKQEVVAKSSLFIKKKKYGLYILNEEGVDVDKLVVTGLEIVRSDSSDMIREMLSQVLESVLKNKPDDEITAIIKKHKKTLKDAAVEDISSYKNVNNINKYVSEKWKYGKGTPYHVKGVANYRYLLNMFGIEDQYEEIHSGNKVMVAYVKNNPWKIEVLTFPEWVPEFEENGIFIDHEKMIDKFYIKKIKSILEPASKEYLLNENRDKVNIFLNLGGM